MSNGVVETVNRIVRQIAQEKQVPMVDFYELILHYQPGDTWNGKLHGENRLISTDGTHPYTDSEYARIFSQAALTFDNGYGARTKLAFDMAEKLKAIVFEDGAVEKGWLTLNPITLSTGIVDQSYPMVNLSATHAVGTVTWSSPDNDLPQGMAISTNGVLSGTPTLTGDFLITIRATDVNGYAEMQIPIKISTPVQPQKETSSMSCAYSPAPGAVGSGILLFLIAFIVKRMLMGILNGKSRDRQKGIIQ